MNIRETRKRIDNIDRKIIDLISKRLHLLKYILRHKIDNNLPIQDKGREKEVLEDRIKRSSSLGINPKLIRSLFLSIFSESRRIQKESLKKLKKNVRKSRNKN